VSVSPHEMVVLVDTTGRPIGHSRKSEVHGVSTPLHRAFSLYLFDSTDRVLLTRRALSKGTWPGVWTNTCCGHPAPGESSAEAVRRRVEFELGLVVPELTCVLPDFWYTATDASGIVENEICPVYESRLLHPNPSLMPNPEEVMEWKWVPWNDLTRATRLAPFAFSPWSVMQIGLLDRVRSHSQ